MSIFQSIRNHPCILCGFILLTACGAFAEDKIDRSTLDEWSAPYRNWYYHPEHVIASDPKIEGYEKFASVDCPTVYQIPGDDRWYMSFIGFDGNGYQSFVAESDDLIHWTHRRLAMGFGPKGEFDRGGRVLGAYLYESYDIDAPRLLKKRDGKYWSLYGAYPRQGGYELRPGYEGVACSGDGLTWERAKEKYILSVHDDDCGEWEKDCIYQPWLVEFEGLFYDFYNAANGSIEQLGLAVSDDLLNWKRYPENPVVRNTPGGYDDRFCSDGKVFWDKDHWVMFYFGVGRNGAHIMAAFSRDLERWTVHPKPLYKAGGHPGGLDRVYAHKISLVYNPQNEAYYMYYCAVGDKGRGIGLITSKPVTEERSIPELKPSVSQKAQFFPLEAVRLLDGPFQKAMQLDAEYLLMLEPDRLLAGFRESKGLESKVERYGGWEREGVAGHSLGHYLTAASLMYASTGDRRFLDRANYIVDELELCQEDNGYVAAIPNGKKVFEEVAAGDIRSAGFDLNGCWVPWYTLHKELAGLLDAHRYCGNQKALAVAKRLGDWAIDVTSNLDEEQFQKMLACEHGGMNESLAELYARTGEKKFLDLSLRFHHKAILDPLSQDVDCLPGIHGNTQIPKIIGAALRYELTGRESDRDIAAFFWDTVIHNHSYVNGGNTEHEHFGAARKLNDRLSLSTTETCNTYNMLKLTRHLIQWRADVETGDYYERALFNHILASQNPDDGMMCYFLPLVSNALKTYNTPFDSFWCCTGTGMENHAKYGESVYFHDAGSLYVNLFISSVLTWKEKGLQVWQETSFPEEGTSKLTFVCREPVSMPVRIRTPRWTKTGIQLTLNGERLEIESRPGKYTVVNREWKNGDALEIVLPMSLRLESMPDNPKRSAIFYGPILLAGDIGSPEEDANDALFKSPVFVTQGKDLNKWIEPIADRPLRFETNGVGRPKDVTLLPLYKMHHRRYSVYWDFFTESEWEQLKADYLAERKRLEKLDEQTVDVMRIGEMQPERDHNLQSERSQTGDFKGKKWRHAQNGGWFSFEMKVDDSHPMELMCTYWGSDGGEREFDVLIDGEKIATQTLQNNKPEEFFDVVYSIPEELIWNKEKVTVRFEAHPGKTAGGLFGCRTIEKE